MTIKDSLYHLIGHSSLQYLVKQMYIVYSSTQVLMDFFGEVIHDNWEQAESYREKIKEYTQQARDMQQHARLNLTPDWFAPVSRENVINLMLMQTRITNKAQAITGLVIGRHLQLPPEVGIEYFPLLNKSIATVQQSYILISHLEDFAVPQEKTKFIGHITDMINVLDELENETDRLQILARNALFAIENTLPPVDAITLYKLLEWTGDLADLAHELGGRLISLLTK
jgi:predicted phosphate transport protein (TIGR00153 family)